MKQYKIFLFAFLLLLTVSCKKDNNQSAQCVVPDIIPFQPYSYPVWHPNGKVLGFNHTPLAGIGTNGVAPCIWYSYSTNPDSTGFYIMNQDGTGLKRITNYYVYDPAWSPDGNWLAFMSNAQLYKMNFTGSGFDTANIIQLTNNGANFFPSWTANSDTIYYDSNVGTPNGTSYYSIWKMTGNGGNQTRVSPIDTYGRQPFIASNNLIYYQYYSGQQPEIFSMNKDGTNQSQVTFNGQYGNRSTPKFFQGNLYYVDNGTLRVVRGVNQDLKLISPCITYDISTTGEIVYGKFDAGLGYDKQKGTLWIINADGTNNHQLTFNNF